MAEINKLLKVNMLGNAIKIACISSAAIMALISVWIYKAPLGGLLVMCLFFIFYLQLPGMFIVNKCGISKDHISTTLAMGVFAGWAFNIFVYFINDAIPGEFLLTAMGPILSVAYIYTWLEKKNRGDAPRKKIYFNKISVALCVFLVITLLYCLLETQYVYLSPAVGDFTYMNPDKAYHMGLINSLSHDYPLQSPWISGIYITYHIFSEMMLSIPVRLFDVQSDVVTQSFGPFFTAYCFGISFYSFFREMSTKPQRAGAYCLISLLANLYVTRKISVSIAYLFILANDNSSGYGVAAALVTIVAFKKWYESFGNGDRDQYGKLLLCIAFVMLTTGIKGPMGAVTIAGIWGAILLGLLLRKVSPKTLLPLAVLTLGFLLVYMTVLGSKGQANASGNSIIAFGKIMNIAFWKEPLFNMLLSYGVPKIVAIGVELVVFMVFFLSIFFFPFCIGYIRELVLVLTRKKEYETPKVLVYAECAVGLVAMFLLSYSGRSQIYFGLVSVFLSPMIAFWFIEDMERARDESAIAKHTLRFCVSMMSITLLFTTYTFTGRMLRHIDTAIANIDPHKSESKYYSVSKEEYEAMEWIENNTEKDALLATDRYYSVDPSKYSYENRWDNRFFLYGVYSNRFSYIGGSGYNIRKADWTIRKDMIETNKKLYDQNNENRGELARKLGVDYVVVSKRFTDSSSLSNDDYELCYSNEDIDIYKISE